MEIKDSGARREFETGAVRDIADGKGRCDLLPLDVVGYILDDDVFIYINNYVRFGGIEDLRSAFRTFILLNKKGWDIFTSVLEVRRKEQ